MSVLQPLESVHLGDRTFNSIRTAIIVGELKPGQPLRDRVLAETLGVSRTPVREALHRLVHAGLVEARGRSGWAVAPFTTQDIHELFELRRTLEPLGINHLEAEPDDETIIELAEFFAGFSPPIPRRRYEAYFERDHAFHKRLVACSGNGRLRDFYAIVESHIDRGRHLLSLGTTGRVDETLDEHRAIAEAIGRRDFGGARAALIRHLDTGERLMIEYLNEHASES